MMNISEMQYPIKENLKKYFGYDDFRPLQHEIVLSLLEQKNCFVLMPTGGGKSLCFQLPATLLPHLCIVISPLIALMKDQVMALKQNGVEAAYINSSLHYNEIHQIKSKCLLGKIKLLYISPETFIQSKEEFISKLTISLIAIDEAHCISNWGHDFRKEYTQLHLLKDMFPKVPIIALTATADKVTRQDILRQLRIEDAAMFVASFDRPNLHLCVFKGAAEKNKIEKIEALYKKYMHQSGIVYCLSRKTTEKVAEKLNQSGILCKAYHAGMTSEERTQVQEDFASDKIRLIIATIAFGMGIDKSDVRYIVHFNMPKTIESYYQEIGRAGRDGKPAETVLFYNLGDLIILRKFAEESEQSEYNLEKLKLMQQYCEANHCRRKILINYFSESMFQDCSYCDVCENPPKFIDGSAIAQKALSAIYRTGQSEASTMIINVLRGSQNKDVIQKNYDRLKTFGVGRDLNYESWQSYLLQLIQLGVIAPAYDENFALKITDFGSEILYGKRNIFLTIPESYAVKSKEQRNVPRPKSNASQKVNIRSPYEIDPALFDELKALRRKFAFEKNLAPFIIFHDSTLKSMCEFLPDDRSKMLEISGVSENKLTQYGDAFIALILDYKSRSHT